MPSKSTKKPTKKPLTPDAARLIRRRREAAGLSQLELAQRVGVPRAQIKRIEAVEVASIDVELGRKILGALGAKKKQTRRKQAKLVQALERAGLLDWTLRDLLA